MGTAIATTAPVSDAEARFALDQREATAMMRSTWVPAHLRSKEGDAATIATLMGIVEMSRKWRMHPQQVAMATYEVRGKVAFEGKLYAALANAHGNLEGNLRIIYCGEGPKLAAVVFGSSDSLSEESKQLLRDFVKTGNSDAATNLELNGVRCVRLSVAECATEQAMWKKDPQQKIFYTGATKWCRRYLPDLVMGVVSVEDLERMEYQREHERPTIEQVTAQIAGPAEQAIVVTAEPTPIARAEAIDAEPVPKQQPKRETQPAKAAGNPYTSEFATCKTLDEVKRVHADLIGSTPPDEHDAIDAAYKARKELLGGAR